MDEKSIVQLAKEVKCIVTVEEHQIAGGMGSAVAELLAQKHPIKIEFLGIKDEFGQSGKPEELIKYYGLDQGSIKKVIKNLLK